MPGQYAVDGQSCVYAYAIVTAMYDTKMSSDLISEVLEPTVEFITEDYRDFCWGDVDGDPLLEAEATCCCN